MLRFLSLRAAAAARPARLRGWLEGHGIALFVALMLLGVLSASAMADMPRITRTGGAVYECRDTAGQVESTYHNEWQALVTVCASQTEFHSREFRAYPAYEYYEFMPSNALPVEPEPPVEPDTSVEPEPPAEPGPPVTDGASVNNGDGTVTLVWLPPTEYTDGTPLEPEAISKFRVYSKGPNQDWTYDGATTTATIRLTESGCYNMEALVGPNRSARSNEVCLR